MKRNNELAIHIAILMIVVVLCFVVCINLIHKNRYEIGISKPKFNVGDCVQQTISDEFETITTNLNIVKVGKTEYQVRYYDNSNNKALCSAYAVSALIIDDEFKKVDCNGPIITIPRSCARDI